MEGSPWPVEPARRARCPACRDLPNAPSSPETGVRRQRLPGAVRAHQAPTPARRAAGDARGQSGRGGLVSEPVSARQQTPRPPAAAEAPPLWSSPLLLPRASNGTGTPASPGWCWEPGLCLPRRVECSRSDQSQNTQPAVAGVTMRCPGGQARARGSEALPPELGSQDNTRPCPSPLAFPLGGLAPASATTSWGPEPALR